MAFKFNAEVRTAQGKGASRRLRNNGQIPAIVYGGSEEPVSIILNHDELNNAQAHESFYSEVITLVIGGGGKEVAVKVQAMQRHPFKPKLVHIDFKRA
ncbi:50S ribosomal protein L25 [Haemophilus influenzae]|uniref:50S ribosomal protein L25 n=1 Tax=Haemophilus influenzae TaxID=727 RepID=UPI000E334303|nr:50S ribosomal protein L25 [Haemophilus influenzae]AXP46509.1 50S ribosomal protein L25 [Haemophilus influenzae]AXP65357.1 50S ribosomal protein L25 [Haemophilus influenzae]MCK9677662.1 50S ribosomal protein L25 [Haemophilus influenzae]